RVEPYSGGKRLLPQFLKPSLLFQRYSFQFGLETGATDPLFLQTYDLDLRYDTATGLPVGKFFYFNGVNSLAWHATLTHRATPRSERYQGFSTLLGEVSLDVHLSREGTHEYLRPGLLMQSVQSGAITPYFGFHLGWRRDTRFKEFGQSFPEEGTFLDPDFRQ